MDLVALLLTLGLLIFIAVFLYLPFLERRAQSVTAEEHELSTLLAERERAFNALQELDFDYKLGKVPEEDYPVQRTNLLQKGADILKRLDEMKPQAGVDDERIEKAVTARRKKKAAASVSDDQIESLIVQRRKSHTSKSAGFCPNCGKPVMADDKFCPSCGKPLAR